MDEPRKLPADADWHTQIVHGGRYETDGWTPWVRSSKETREMISGLAANKFARETGWVGNTQGREPLVVTVLTFGPGDLVHENGQPLTCYSTKYTFTRDRN